MKETYTEKIAKLNPTIVQSNGLFTPARRHSINRQEIESLDACEIRKMKNKISAQKSRRIKKEYIAQLQTKVKELELQLQLTKKRERMHQEYIGRFCDKQQIIESYMRTKEQLFGKMQKLAYSGLPTDEAEINMVIDSLRLRYGATGRERTSLIDYYFKRILDFMVPDIHKYMLYAADQQIDIFSPPNQHQQQGQLYNLLKIQEQTKEYVSKNFKSAIVRQRQKLSSNLGELFRVKYQLEEQIRRLQGMFDQIRKYMPVGGLAKFIVSLEKNNGSSEVKKVMEFWHQTVEEQMEIPQSNAKRIKKEQRN